MKGALIGFGTIAQGHFWAYQQIKGLSIVAVVDPTPEGRNRVLEYNKNINVYETAEDLFLNEKLDFVDICTPPDSHLKYIHMGMKNNCHVICEKPFLCSMSDYSGLISLSKKQNKIIYPSHNYKFAPILKQIHDRVQSKNFGEVINGHFRTLRSGHAIGVKTWDAHWRRKQNIANGGILRDHGTHSVYMATHLTGDVPVAVSCLIGNLNKNEYTENEDTALLTLYFKKGKQFLIDLSWAANYRNSYYSITGTKEFVVVENDEIRFTSKGEFHQENLSSEFNDPTHKIWFVDVLQNFQDCVKSPNLSYQILEEALMTTAVVETAYESSKLGGIKLDLPDLSTKLL